MSDQWTPERAWGQAVQMALDGSIVVMAPWIILAVDARLRRLEEIVRLAREAHCGSLVPDQYFENVKRLRAALRAPNG